MRGIAGARIWYQSFTDPDADRPYFTRLKEYLGSVASPGCQVEAFGIQPGARYPGPITDFRCAAQAIANALTAQEQGYDAFVIGNFQEAGLAEARSAVRIPVIGLGEATMLHACTLGRKIGLIATTPVHIPYHQDQIARHGLHRRVIAVQAVQADVGRFNRAFDDEREYRSLREAFVGQAVERQRRRLPGSQEAARRPRRAAPVHRPGQPRPHPRAERDPRLRPGRQGRPGRRSADLTARGTRTGKAATCPPHVP